PMLDPVLLAALSALLPVWDAWCPDDGRVAAGLAALTTPSADLAQASANVFAAVELAQDAGAPPWLTAAGIGPALEARLMPHLGAPVASPLARAHCVAVVVWFAIWHELWENPAVLPELVPAIRRQARRVIAAIVVRAAQDGWRS